MTRKEFRLKWDAIRYEDMDDAQFKDYIEDCFSMYETEGFHTNNFRGLYSDSKKFNGQTFEVVRRCTTKDGFDLEVLPAWVVRFQDGTELQAFPEEVCNGTVIE